MIITVTLNPAVDKTVFVPGFAVDAVNRVERVVLDPGGKGLNVSKSAQALGAQTICLGILGSDTGEYIARALDQMQLRHHMVRVEAPTRTNTKVVDLRLGTNTDINEPGAEVSEQTVQAVWQSIEAYACEGDTVVFAGKNPPGTPTDLLARWTNALQKKGVHVCLDTVGKPMLLAMEQNPCVIKPNVEELEELMQCSLPDETAVVGAARELTHRGIELVAVSMGGDGAVFVTKDQAVRTQCPKVKVVSTVGAGDSMMAAIAVGLEQGLSLEEIARRATATATATVQVEGSKPASLAQVEETIPQIIIRPVQ